MTTEKNSLLEFQSENNTNEHIRVVSIKCTDEENTEIFIPLYLGEPQTNKMPIFFQIKALEEKGYTIDQECVSYIKDIQDIANKRHIHFLDLLDYTLNAERV